LRNSIAGSTSTGAHGTIEEDEGIFLITLNADGVCTEFWEWWNSRSFSAS